MRQTQSCTHWFVACGKVLSAVSNCSTCRLVMGAPTLTQPGRFVNRKKEGFVIKKQQQQHHHPRASSNPNVEEMHLFPRV